MNSKFTRYWLLGWASFAVIASIHLTFFATFTTELSDFIPQPSNATREVTSSVLEGPSARMWMVGISGSSDTTLAQFSQQFAAKLSATGHFARVYNGAGEDGLNLQSLLFDRRYFVDRRLSADYFSVGQLRSELLNRLSELNSPLSSVTKNLLARDPTGSFFWFLDEMDRTLPKPESHLGVWFSSDKSTALLVGETVAPAMALDNQEKVREAIAATFEELNVAHDLKLTLAGVPSIALATRKEIKNESQRLSLLASCGVLAVLWYFFRSIRVVLIAAIPLFGGMLAGAFATSLIFGSVHGIVLAFGATLLGVATDYPVHLFSHTLPQQNLQESATRIWGTLRLVIITTLLGYMALVGSSVSGLAQLGVFSVCGILAAGWITRTALPAFSGQITSTPLPDGLTNLLLARPPWSLRVLGGVFAVACCVYLAQKQEIWSSDIASLSPLPSAVRQQLSQMQHMLGISDSLFFIRVTATNEEEVLQRSERVLPLLFDAVSAGDIRGFEATAQFLPSLHAQIQRQQAVPTVQELRHRLNLAAQDLPFKMNLFEPFISDMQQFRAAPPLSSKDLAETLIGEKLLRLLSSTQAASYAIIPLSGVASPTQLRDQVNQAGVAGVEFVDIKKETNEGLRYLRDEALNRTGLALLMIVIVLGFGLREMGRLFRVVGAVACAFVTAAAGAALIHGAINLFHLVSLLLVVGLSMDYGLFFSRSPEGEEARRSVHGIVVCCLSTLVVFAVLASASIPVLRHIGITVTIGVAASFIYAALFSRSFTLQKAAP